MKKLTAKPKRITRPVGVTDDGLARDYERRLRNALLALGELDTGWMYWIERNIPRGLGLRYVTAQVERQARLLVARRYRYFGRANRLGVVYGDFHFTDDGNLKMYL